MDGGNGSKNEGTEATEATEETEETGNLRCDLALASADDRHLEMTPVVSGPPEIRIHDSVDSALR